jgi:hypothetical protein
VARASNRLQKELLKSGLFGLLSSTSSDMGAKLVKWPLSDETTVIDNSHMSAKAFHDFQNV